LKILHVGNTAGVASTLVKYQRRLGHVSSLIVRTKHPFGYDYEVSCSNLSAMMRLVFADAIHYHSAPWIYRALGGRIRFPDYAVAKTLGKRIVWHFHGHEVRQPEVRHQRFPRLDCPMIVSTPDLLRYLPEAIWIPNPVDTELFSPKRIPHSKIVVGCYDSPNPYVRSFSPITETLAAVKQLERNGVGIKVRLLSGYKHHNVPRYFQQIDIWIDKFGMNFYGLCALEASLCEVPVVAQMGEFERHLVPMCPFILTERQKIKKSIECLLDEDVRHDLGRKGADFARHFHDPTEAAEKCLRIYQR